MTILIDTREPWPHPWQPYLLDGWHLERGTLETGDLAVARLPEGVIIERKTASDLAGCIGINRERFERELRRGRYCGRFLVIIEADLDDVVRAAAGIHRNAVIGTLAAWSVRYCPFIFAGSTLIAAGIAFRALATQVRDAERIASQAQARPLHHAPLSPHSAARKTLPRAAQGKREAGVNINTKARKTHHE